MMEARRMPVLLVEDDTMVRLTLADFLDEAGLQLQEADSAGQALAILRNPAQPVDVLVTDLDLGGGDNGLALAQQAKQLLPKLQVIYATGSPHILEGHSLATWEKVFIKPFNPSALVAMVAAMEEQQHPWRLVQPQILSAGMTEASSL
ncbi:MAG: response regulator [Proteobacteria bacterium]|nr:MAG: response regulator [Pseudomonadota bacterium]